MSFIISDAWAEAAPAAQQPDPIMGFLPLIIIFVVFYFLLIRPQTKRAKEQKAMIDALVKGDEVVTGGGVLGRITDVMDGHVRIEIADGVQILVQKQAVAALLPKGTLKDMG